MTCKSAPFGVKSDPGRIKDLREAIQKRRVSSRKLSLKVGQFENLTFYSYKQRNFIQEEGGQSKKVLIFVPILSGF